MTPDKKYMSEVNLKNDSDFSFTPPSFDWSLFRVNPPYKNYNNSLNLYPDQTQDSELYCYYNILGNCDQKNVSDFDNIQNRTPTPFDILRGLDLDLEETIESYKNSDDVDKIYSEIQLKNPGFHETFTKYGIPDPIYKILIKRLIKLTLLYNDKSR
ncbi:MAG: hypothetical protein E7207_02435 [Clostridium butyricum]|nr:hypothetical protein [Clostridium butyricum]